MGLRFQGFGKLRFCKRDLPTNHSDRSLSGWTALGVSGLGSVGFGSGTCLPFGGGGGVGLGLLCFGGLGCKAFGVTVFRKIHNLGRASTESLYSFGEFSMRAIYG